MLNYLLNSLEMSYTRALSSVAVFQTLCWCYILWQYDFVPHIYGLAKIEPKSESKLSELPYKPSELSYKPCEVPIEGFKAWNKGVVTVIKPEIKKNCSKIISGDILEIKQVTQLSVDWKNKFSHEMFSTKSQNIFKEMLWNCKKLGEYLTNNLYNTELEINFPVAYIFVVYDNPQQILRLLKLLYRPQNVYCIHHDKKSVFHSFFSRLSMCLHNIITATKLIDVMWSDSTVMEAQVGCMSDLVNYREKQDKNSQWKYVINLCGKELPLHSTKGIVKKLISMNGTSSISTRSIPVSERQTMSRLKNKMLPYNLTFYKGMAYVALSASFVTFLVRNTTAQLLFNFFKDTEIPDEHFYPTLFHMPGAPGGYTAEIAHGKYFKVSHYIWMRNQANQKVNTTCNGNTVHNICIVNHADLPRIMLETKNGSTALFHNKYFIEDNHVIMDCMEEKIVAMNKLEYELECSKRPGLEE